ncbi:MAG: PCRF domain-containing protein, partial [Acidobacteriota bacterium]|nr:PCRF domain-containing protein [Acidobacteriota bacterium]
MAELDRQAQAEGFWEDPAASAPILRERRAVERRLETYRRLAADSEELAAWRELVAEGLADADLDAFLERLEPRLRALELELKLSGPDDDKNALLAIHPGAGGTESQDWAEMLLRMYLRWAEARGYE